MISDMKIAKNVEYNERNVILTISELERGEGGGGGGGRVRGTVTSPYDILC